MRHALPGNGLPANRERDALARQFHTVHPFAGKTIPRIVFWPGSYLDAAPAVISAPSSPEHPAEVFRRPQGLVARDGACRGRLPRPGVLARWNDGMGPPPRSAMASWHLRVSYGMLTARVFCRRLRVLKSGTSRSRPMSRNRLRANPVVCRADIVARTNGATMSAMPNSTFIVRQVWHRQAGLDGPVSL